MATLKPSPAHLRRVVCSPAEYLEHVRSPRHKDFIQFYLDHGNPLQAFYDAGYTAENEQEARKKAARLMRHPAVEQALDTALGMDLAVIGKDVTVPRTLAELARVAFSDPRNVVDENGNLLKLEAMDASTAAAIRSIKMKLARPDSEDVEAVVEITFWDKLSALDKIAKHLGLQDVKLRLADADGGSISNLIQQLQGSALVPSSPILDITPVQKEPDDVVDAVFVSTEPESDAAVTGAGEPAPEDGEWGGW